MPGIEQLLVQLSDFHFLRPEWFYVLIPTVLLYLLLKKRDATASNWSKSIDSMLLPYLIETSGTPTRRNPFYLLLIAWLIMITALAGPVWQKTPQPVQTKEDALIIVLDLSLSMYAVDIKPNRITRARQKLLDIVTKREEGVTGLIVYAGDAHVVSPLTDDADTIAAMVPSLAPEIMPIYGSAFAPAMELALQMFKDGNVSNGRILLIADDVPDMASSQAIVQDNRSHFPVSILAMGTADAAPIMLPDQGSLKDAQGVIVIPRVDFTALQNLADAAGGRQTAMTVDDTDIDYLLAESTLLESEQYRQIERDFDVWYEQGPWLVLLLLPLAALAFRRGWIWCLLLVLLSPHQDIYAEETPAAASDHAVTTAKNNSDNNTTDNTINQFWQDLWQTSDQQAIAALQQGDAEQAAKTFTDPAWKGSASYLSGNYQQASDIFQQLETPDSNYNLGNALARQSKYKQAIAAYDKTLAVDPLQEDAKFNRDLVEKLLQQQDQQNQDQQNQDQKNQDQQNKKAQQQKDQDQNGDKNQQSDAKDGDSQPGQDSQNQQQNQQEQDQSGQDQQKQEQQQAEQQARDDAAKERQDGSEAQQAAESQLAKDEQAELDEETKQALDQWLRRIPDDPGGLLKKKFEYQTKQRRQKGQGKYKDRNAVW